MLRASNGKSKPNIANQASKGDRVIARYEAFSKSRLDFGRTWEVGADICRAGGRQLLSRKPGGLFSRLFLIPTTTLFYWENPKNPPSEISRLRSSLPFADSRAEPGSLCIELTDGGHVGLRPETFTVADSQAGQSWV